MIIRTVHHHEILHAAKFRGQYEKLKRDKHDLQAATMVPLSVIDCGTLGPAGAKYLQGSASVACATGVPHRAGLLYST
jgi:hypothetical protein